MISIRLRLTLALLAGFILLLGAGGAAVYFTIRESLTKEFDLALQARALAVASLLRMEDGRLEMEAPAETGEDAKGPGRPDGFELRQGNELLARRAPGHGFAGFGEHPALTETPQFWRALLADGRPARVVGFRFRPQVEQGDEPAPATREASLVFVRDGASLEHALHRLLVVLAGVGGMALAGTMLVVPLAVRLGLRPLSELAAEAEKIDAAMLDRRFGTEKLASELQPIGAKLNDLLSRLEDSFTRERRFSGDVAHELRTPVAELRALAEVALRWPEAHQGTTAAFEDALNVARKMERIVTGLLLLVRCDAGRPFPEQKEIPLRGFCADAWQPLAEEASRKRFQVQFKIQADAVAWCDPGGLDVILANLFANAVHYAPPGTELRIQARRSGSSVFVSVSNQAPDLSAEDLPRLCDRFWRKDPARHDSAHSGLGLSIALACARVLGGSLELEMTSPGILTARLAIAAAGFQGKEEAREMAAASAA